MAKSRYNEVYYRKIKKAPPRNVYMERFFEHLEGGLKNYGVSTCCLLFPLRKGLLILGYFNIFVEMTLIIGAATDSISPLFKKTQEIIVGVDAPPQSVAVAIPTTELAFTVVLLCATHRNDVGLLRFYMVYSCVAIGLTVVSYAIVMANLTLFFVFALLANVSYQAYILILVRSLVVKIRQAKCEVRMLSLKELLNRKEIDVEAPAPAPVHRPVPKDLGPGPLAAIVGNPKVEIIVKSDTTDVNDIKTVAEIKKDTKVMVEKIKKSNIEIKTKEDIDKLNEKEEEIKVERPLKDTNAKGVLHAKLSFLGIKQIEKNNDRPDQGSETKAIDESKDKDVKKPKKTIFGRKTKDTDISEKDKHQTTETNETTKDKKQKKTLFRVNMKGTDKAKDISQKNEPETIVAEVRKPETTHVKQDANDKKQNSMNEETKVAVETKLKNNDVEKNYKTDDVDKSYKTETKSQKETKSIKEKRKIHKQTDAMEEIKLDVDTGPERQESTKLETIEEEPRRKWFWKK